MKTLLLVSLTALIFSCVSYKTVPLKNKYSNGNFEAVSDNSKEKVWDNIIDFFSKNGLSIRIIDRSSGLIVSNETALTWTYETKDGKLQNPNAWIVIAKTVMSGSTQPIKPSQITGEWNIRIKDAEKGKTSVAVNLVNTKSLSSVAGSSFVPFRQGNFQSTGVFERWIYDQVK